MLGSLCGKKSPEKQNTLLFFVFFKDEQTNPKHTKTKKITQDGSEDGLISEKLTRLESNGKARADVKEGGEGPQKGSLLLRVDSSFVCIHFWG